MTARDRDYADQLGAVLRRRDVSALRAFLVSQAGRYGDERQVAAIEGQSDDELAALLDRMILARADLADLHPESMRRLGGGEPPAPEPPPPGARRPPRHRRPRRPPV